MIKRTEQEIIENWGNAATHPLVSISCITYNQENYISQTIDSFLIQETTFPFEILIHDDASTDRTAEIIRSYEKKYPTLIKPIYQIENQYSQGKIMSAFNFARAKGQYIAFCEGDDFWIDKDKLQIQTENMKEHDECQISFHPAKIMNDQAMTDDVAARHAEHDTVFDVKEVIMGDGGFCPTPSVMIKKAAIDKLPEFFKNAPAEDYFLQVIGAMNAGALYIDRTMSAYRIHPNGVWTSKLNNFKLLKKAAIDMSISLQEMDEHYNFSHHEEISFLTSHIFLQILGNKIFYINDRIDLYNICKSHLSKKQQIEQQQYLIDEQAKLIKDYETSVQQLQTEIEEKNNILRPLLGSIKKITRFPVTKNPIKKYKAYKAMLMNYSKIE